MKKFLLFVMGFIGCAQVCFCMQSPLVAKVEALVQKYAPPKEMAQLLEEHKKVIKKDFIDASKNGEYCGLFIKGSELSRVVHAERMRQCIKNHKLDSLDVPKKYIYDVDGHWIVIAQCVRYEVKPLKLQLNEVQQLAILAEETGFIDWKLDLEGLSNWVRSYSGKLICLDTENLSFLGTNICKAFCVENLLNYPSIMTEEAIVWLKDRVDFLETSQQENKII